MLCLLSAPLHGFAAAAKPLLMLISIDGLKPEAVLERIDAIVGALRTAAEKSAPGAAAICAVSDHGFARIEHDVNLYAAFLADGWFTLDDKQRITSWKAIPWPAGGSAAVMLADPNDDAVRTQVAALLAKLASDPEDGIAGPHAPLTQAELPPLDLR
jgi:hypothetical protein